MTTVSAIRTALAAQLVSALGLRQGYDVEPTQVNLPCAIVTKVDGAYQQNMGHGTLALYSVEVVLLVKSGDPARDQRTLDSWLTPTAMNPVEGTLGGVVDLVTATQFRDAGTIMRGNVAYTGAFVDFQVWAS